MTDQGPHPWQTDRPLTAERAAEIIRAAFPSVRAAPLHLIGNGWEFDAYRTADGWLFRFPRREECAHNFDREAKTIALVAPAMPPSIALPIVELRAPPRLGFPYPIAGHRFINGVPADHI